MLSVGVRTWQTNAMFNAVKATLFLFTFLLLPSCSAGNPVTSSSAIPPADWANIKTAIAAQRQAGHPNYNPTWIYIVDPRAQHMHVLSLKTGKVQKTLPCTTGYPVPDIDEAHILIPYLKQSAGKFDPTANPNANVRNSATLSTCSTGSKNSKPTPY